MKVALAGLIAWLALFAAAPASSALITVDFVIEGGSWFQETGTGSPFGLPAQPTLHGNLTINDTTSSGAAFVGVDYVTGTKTWSVSEIDTAGSVVNYSGPGIVSSFVLDFNIPDNFIVSDNTVQISDGTNVIACNFCVNFTNASVPEPSTWAMTLLGFAGLGFVGYRQGQKFARAASV